MKCKDCALWQTDACKDFGAFDNDEPCEMFLPAEEYEKKDEECPIRFEIVVNGNCAVCGKPLTGDRFMICKECEGK